MQQSRSLKVKKITDALSVDNYATLKKEISSIDWHYMDQVPWPEQYAYRPNVKFQICHNSTNIYLHYEVEENHVRALHTRPNQSVYEDSCVEFFVSLDNRQTYYNFEFNVLGTGLVGYGSTVRSERRRLDDQLIEKIDTFTQVIKIAGQKKWSIILIIPKSIFGGNLELHKPLYGNFYKCGDKLPEPHYVVWNNIQHIKPNFHLPEFFGELIFE